MKFTRLFSVFTALTLLGCTDGLEFDNLYLDDINSTYALQIGFGDYTMGELLDELEGENFTIDSTSGTVVQLRFQLDSTFVDREDVLRDTEIVDIEPVSDIQNLTPFQSIDFSPVGGSITNTTGSPASFFDVASTAGLSISPDELIDTLEFEYIAQQGSSVTDIYYRDGFFIFQLAGLNIEYSFTALNTFNTASGLPMDLNEQRDETQPIQLNGFYTDFETVRDPADAADDTLNIVKYRLRLNEVTLLPGQTITNGTPVNVQVETGSLSIRSFQSIRGSFNEQTFDIDSETIEFDAFDEFSNGTIVFEDPQIVFGIESYLGIPVNLDFSAVEVVTQDAPQGLPLTIKDPSIGNIDAVTTFEPLYADLVPAIDQVVMNRETTNINELFEGIPTAFVFDVSATMPQQANSFATIPPNDSDRMLAVGGEAILPLSFTISDVEEIFDFDGIGTDDITSGDTVAMVIYYKNSIPLEIDGTIGFVSAANDTTYAAQAFQLSNNVNVSNFDTAELLALTPTTIALSRSEIEEFLDAERILVQLQLNSPSGTVTSLTVDQKIYFELSVFAGLNIEL